MTKMLDTLHISHITGTKTIYEELNNPKRKTIGQMFFKPYESRREFLFGLKQVALPSLLLGIGLIDYAALALGTLVFSAAACATGLILAAIKLATNDIKESYAAIGLKTIDYVLTGICQNLINLIVLPVSALILVTRSLSTGLQAAGIYDFNAQEEKEETEECGTSYSYCV